MNFLKWFLEKDESPEFTGKCHFFNNAKLRISERTKSSGSGERSHPQMVLCAAQELGYTERLKEPFNQSQEIQKQCFGQIIYPDF